MTFFQRLLSRRDCAGLRGAAEAEWLTKSLAAKFCTLSSCFPRSQNRDLGHPSFVKLQAV
jgi:hypothetical protein